MPNRTCSVDGCEQPHKARGYCVRHYHAQRNAGKLPKLIRHTHCTVADCTKPHNAHGYCHTHYDQMRRGETPGKIRRVALTMEERFWEKVDKTATCWLWVGAKHGLGYGSFWDGEKNTVVKAHRWAYEKLVGPLAPTAYVDHICFTLECVRPDHLRVTTPKENGEHRRGPNRNSRTGIRGVYWSKSSQKYAASVGHLGREHFLGYFDSLDEADRTVRDKRAELFTHDDATY